MNGQKGQVQLHKFSKNADQKLGKRTENARMWAEVITKRSNPIAHAWNSVQMYQQVSKVYAEDALAATLKLCRKKARLNITCV